MDVISIGILDLREICAVYNGEQSAVRQLLKRQDDDPYMSILERLDFVEFMPNVTANQTRRPTLMFCSKSSGWKKEIRIY